MQAAAAVITGRAEERDAVRRDQAFRAAITPLVATAIRVLRRLGVANSEIDDALQRVLVIADRRFDELATQQDLKAYVCAVCVNIARDVGRVRARRLAQAVPVDDLEQAAVDPSLDPEDSLERKQAIELVQRVLSKMPEERRVVFVLYELEELSVREISEHLEVPIGTVASRLRIAREEFRAAIARENASGRGLR